MTIHSVRWHACCSHALQEQRQFRLGAIAVVVAELLAILAITMERERKEILFKEDGGKNAWHGNNGRGRDCEVKREDTGAVVVVVLVVGDSWNGKAIMCCGRLMEDGA